MKVGDIFYSVMQKDNNPFEKPRITKFVVDKIYNENFTHPIVATKTDKWGRHYCFKQSQIYSTYVDAIPEKNEKLEKIRQWEKDKAEWDAKIFEEQRKREELEKNQKAIECLEEAKREFETYYADNIWNYPQWIDQKISELKGENND